MSRLPELKPEEMTPEQKEIYQSIVSGPRGSVPAPLTVWLRRPELCRHAQALGSYCRYDTALPPRLSELAIMLMGRHWLAEYEWATHKPHALAAGLSEDVLNAVRDGREPQFANRDEAVLYAFFTRLHAERKVDDALYAEAVELLGEDGVIDLIGIVGYYTLISTTIQAFELSATYCKGPKEMPESL
ncbi:hypothetical protein LJC26_01570 [Desulfovibrio sp. OttesenSCG-928-O18]|nr:hypothetical protein [Desulfovibrio sp. OttesenSCG-928-O18]